MEHTATCSSHALMFCGTLPAQDFATGSFQGRLQSEMARRLEKKKKDPAGGGKGFQRTPAFVHAVALDVLDGTASEGAAEEAEQQLDSRSTRLPQGGFTDVGQHTGGQHRGTAWPLVRQTILVRALIQLLDGSLMLPLQQPALLCLRSFAP